MKTGLSRAFLLGVVTAVVATSTGCGSAVSDAAEGAGGGEGGAGGGGELTTVRVGAIPVTDTAVLMLGESQGFFEERGIDLEIGFSEGGAAVVPAVVSGEYQLGYSNTISIFQAREKGLPLKILAVSAATHADPELGINDLVVASGSPLQSAADLNGKRVAVNTLGNFAEILARAAIDNAGGDSSTVQFVELPFPEQIPALERGDVDAFLAGEPFRAIALDAGHRVLANSHQEMSPEDSFITGGWFATDQAIAEDPELFENLQAAINESNDYATEHGDEMRAVIPEYTGMDEATTERINLSAYPAELTVEDLSVLADAAVKYGILESEPDYDAVIQSF